MKRSSYWKRSTLRIERILALEANRAWSRAILFGGTKPIANPSHVCAINERNEASLPHLSESVARPHCRLAETSDIPGGMIGRELVEGIPIEM